MDGGRRLYIASQGPLPNTCADFWHMVHQQRVEIVVMLTTVVEGGRVKCHKYWPGSGEVLRHGALNVRRIPCNECTLKPNQQHRHFSLEHEWDTAQQLVVQLQCGWWPDHGVPDDVGEFVEYVETIRTLRRETSDDNRPLLVHCSAGIGRTGVLILVETALELMEDTQNIIEPIEIVRKMREQRYAMVQNNVSNASSTPSISFKKQEQFKFACNAIVHAFDIRYAAATTTNKL